MEKENPKGEALCPKGERKKRFSHLHDSAKLTLPTPPCHDLSLKTQAFPDPMDQPSHKPNPIERPNNSTASTKLFSQTLPKYHEPQNPELV